MKSFEKKIRKKYFEDLIDVEMIDNSDKSYENFEHQELDKCFQYLSSDVSRMIYVHAIRMRNTMKKLEAANHASKYIADRISKVCRSKEDVTFQIESEHFYHLNSCWITIKNEGRETKIATIVFKTGDLIRVYIGKDSTGEYKIKFVSMRSAGDDDFSSMIASRIASYFDNMHVLIDLRRPTISWLKKQLTSKSIEEIANITGCSLYRIKRLIF